MIRTNKHLICFICTLIVIACGSCEDVKVPRWDLYQPAKKSLSAPQNVSTTNNLVVYLDTSASMAGYLSPNGKNNFSVAPDGNTVFSKTLLELRNVVTTLSPQPQVAVRKVDANISAPSFSDLDLSQSAVNRSLYNGKETNLAGAVRSFAAPLDEKSEDKSPPLFHVLVTDGVQSSDKNNTSVNCAQGSDSFCVKKQLLELINSGWGGAILGLKSEFDGNVYSEISHKPVPYSTAKNADKFRPFYLYIFSPDRTALDKLVDALRQKLAPLGREDSFRQYSLTSDYANGAATVEINQSKESKDILDVKKEVLKDSGIAGLTVKVALSTAGKNGQQQFGVIVKPVWSNQALVVGSPDEMASLVKWEVKQIYPEKEDEKNRYPNFKIVKQEAKNGAVELTVETGWSPGVGQADCRLFQVLGTLDVNKNTPPWVAAWTTNLDTDASAANKTLNIESSLANLWKNSALENYPVAEFGVRVCKK